MPVYDIHLRDDMTSQDFRYRLESRTKCVAEARARSRAKPARIPVGSGKSRKAPLQLVSLSRVSDVESFGWFKERLKSERRWGDAQNFIETMKAQLVREHPQWDAGRLEKACWRAMMTAFPAEGSLEPAQRKRLASARAKANRAAKIEKLGVDGVPRQRLLKAALSLNERGGIQDDTEWVYQNLEVCWEQIDISSVPSPGSVALLRQAKEDTKWFLQTYHAKLLPTKARIESEGWLESDDGQVSDMANRVREEEAMLLSGVEL